MHPNDINGWYLFFANQKKYIFKKINQDNIQITIEANSYDEAKELLIESI